MENRIMLKVRDVTDVGSNWLSNFEVSGQGHWGLKRGGLHIALAILAALT